MQKDDYLQPFIPGKTRIKYGGAFVTQKEFDAIQSVLDRNWWTIDEHGRKLEEEIAQFVGLENKYAVTLTNSGSSGLMIAYAALKEKYLNDGDEIITGAVQFPTTISSLYYNRLTPVYIDVDATNICLDVNLIEAAITAKTKAILVVAIAGNIPNLDEIQKIAKKHRLFMILDNCDGFGGTWKGKPIESYFDIAVTSFHAAHIMAMGEGGAVITGNELLGDVAHAMREWGRLGDTDTVPEDLQLPVDYPGRYVFRYMGFNMKPLELQCAMGREQLKKLSAIKKLRQAKFTRLYLGLLPLQDQGYILLPEVNVEARPSWFGFPILAENRPALRKFLEDRQIETRTIFGGNITKQPAFKTFGRIASGLPIANRVMDEGMFVSTHPSLTNEMIDYMIQSFKEFYA